MRRTSAECVRVRRTSAECVRVPQTQPVRPPVGHPSPRKGEADFGFRRRSVFRRLSAGRVEKLGRPSVALGVVLSDPKPAAGGVRHPLKLRTGPTKRATSPRRRTASPFLGEGWPTGGRTGWVRCPMPAFADVLGTRNTSADARSARCPLSPTSSAQGTPRRTPALPDARFRRRPRHKEHLGGRPRCPALACANVAGRLPIADIPDLVSTAM